MWSRDLEGSVLESDGRVIHFSHERFVRDICLGDYCFVCGADPGTRTFNQEHILPKWFLGRHQLHDSGLRLINGTAHPYRTYKLACCEPCNSAMARAFEGRISELFPGNGDDLIDYLYDQGPALLFAWMCLLFLKVQLKDFRIPVSRDRRKPQAPIGLIHDRNALHLAHTFARLPASGMVVEEHALGTLITARVKGNLADFCDFSDAHTIGFCSGGIGVIAVVDDGAAVSKLMRCVTRDISTPLEQAQFRELVARVAQLSVRLRTRPTFTVECNLDERISFLRAEVPRHVCADEPAPDRQLGEAIARCCGELFEEVGSQTGVRREVLLDMLREGSLSFLFDDAGNFIRSDEG